MHETKTVDSEFRLWVSVQPHPDIPSSLLQSAVKIVADSPKVHNRIQNDNGFMPNTFEKKVLCLFRENRQVLSDVFYEVE